MVVGVVVGWAVILGVADAAGVADAVGVAVACTVAFGTGVGVEDDEPLEPGELLDEDVPVIATEVDSLLDGLVEPTATLTVLLEDTEEPAVTTQVAVAVPVMVPIVCVELPEDRVQPDGIEMVALVPVWVPNVAIVKVIVAVWPAVIVLLLDASPRVHDGISETVIVFEPVAVPVVLSCVAVTVNGLVYVPVCDAVSENEVDCVPAAENVSVLLQVEHVSPLFGATVTVTEPVRFERVTVTGTEMTSFLYKSVW
jgi:hypothetical protein